MRRAAFVVNSAAARHLDRLERWCQEAAASHGWEALFIGAAPGPAGRAGRAELARYLAEDSERLVFAAGGDGTVRTCAQAIWSSGAPTPLAVVPWGTANLFARAIGAPAHPQAALRAGFGGGEIEVDLASCDGYVVVAMAGMGLDATVVAATPALLKEHLGWASYAIAGLGNLHVPPHDFTVRLDGGEPITRSARTVVVGNMGTLPGGFLLLPEARLDDGLLDVAVLSPRGPLGWAWLAAHVLAGAPHDGPYLERYQAKHVEVEAAAELPRQVDGEVITAGRSLSVEVLPGALRVRAAQ